ncbi:MAG TPA: OmcA/MtrC family decaheme c-type cytochrome [Anaeromyxobacteraceae bacterium]|nr:OmcA/MtrC family decaheme c-type cytochrome [Anaeromyxobacteraceae bacterium]
MHRRPAWRRLAPLAGLALAACSGPVVGGQVVASGPTTWQLTITAAQVTGQQAAVDFTLLKDGQPLALADLTALRPSFTLAALGTDPLSGLDTWQSCLLTGRQTMARLPLGGPGTAALVNQKQPGTDPSGVLTDQGGGRFHYAYSTPLPAICTSAGTLRAGLWLGGAPAKTRATSVTYDFAPGGGPAPAQRETVLTQSCERCHGTLAAHGGVRLGVRLCLTCHTIQNADPDTADPAAPARALTVNPDSRDVLAGSGATTFTATLLQSTAAVGWSLGAADPGTLSAGSGPSVQYTPPAAVAAPTAVTLTATAAGLSFPVTVNVTPPAATPPAVAVGPSAQAMVAGTGPSRFTATLTGVAGPIAWTLSPAGLGTLSATSGAAVDYTPPLAISADTVVTLTATAGGQSGAAALTVRAGAVGGATPLTDPNPLDLGRMVHRIHRGKKLPTLALASSTAPAPALPSAAALPLPYAPGRNKLAPGARFAIVGVRSTAFVPGQVAARTDNGQPARLVAEGIGYPRDLRDCDACHAGAPQASATEQAISRRTCEGCHPDVWFGSGPITDLVHFAHPGGPQPDDTKCVECHVPGPTRPTVRAPIADIHVAPIQSPHFDQLTLRIVSVSSLAPGLAPTVVFTLADRNGPIGALGAPAPATDPQSPVPRALTRVAFTLAGPTSDYQSGNVPVTELVPLTSVADALGQYGYTFKATVPAGATGTWTIGSEARRQAATTLYDPATDAFAWPYTGETITEYADNAVVEVDTAFGSWPGGAPAPRRAVVERDRCRTCHLELSLHGGLRHDPAYCVMCHTPDGTDWGRRPKDAGGNVNLATVYGDTQYGTYDGVEERSIHLKVMVHRIHTGEGQGPATLATVEPHVVYGYGGSPYFFDDVAYPNRLADCTACHAADTFALEAIPAGAAPTVANETASIRHAATAAHVAGEPRTLPIAAACLSCHADAFGRDHAARNTSGTTERCAQCHSRGTTGVREVHGLPPK